MLFTEEKLTDTAVYQTMRDIEEAMVGKPKVEVMFACLAIPFILQNPNISSEDLKTGVRDISERICVLLCGLNKDGSPMRMN